MAVTFIQLLVIIGLLCVFLGLGYLSLTCDLPDAPEKKKHKATPPVLDVISMLNTKGLIFHYEGFQTEEPGFMTERDRYLFRMNPDNIESLKPASVDKLSGQITCIPHGSIHSDIDCGWQTRDHHFQNNRSTTRSNQHFTVLAPLLVPQSNTFQHFLDGVLPKLVQARDQVLLHENVTIMLYRPWDAVIQEMMDYMGFDESRVYYYDSGIYTADYLINLCQAPPLHPGLWQKARKLLGASDKADNNRKISYVILLGRENARNYGRRIKNYNEVAAMLKEKYGSALIIFNTSRNLAHSRNLFSHARMLIGVHGGAFYNMFFCPNGTEIVEVMPTEDNGRVVPEQLAHTIIWRMSLMLGQKYWRIAEPPVDLYGNVKVNVSRLSHTLHHIDSIGT